MATGQNPLAVLAAQKNFRVGSVLHKFCEFTTPPKNKFLVVASIEPKLLVLVINSEINKFYFREKLDVFHVPVPAEGHDFLSHDSYTNCIEAFEAFDCSDIKHELLINYQEIFKGWLSDECLEEVYKAVKSNFLIRQGHQKEILASIESQLPHLNSTL